MPGRGASGYGYKLTPVMQQYLDLKQRHEDAVLFFRLGDFYEMFFDDAERASKLLDIALTTRNRNEDRPIPMCGVPCHSAKPYIAKLLRAGVKVALCEQIKLVNKGIARREVTRVITPGTAIEEESLVPDHANFLASVACDEDVWGLAWTDFSTGELQVTETASLDALEDEITAVAPAELLVPGPLEDSLSARLGLLLPGCVLTPAAERAEPNGAGRPLRQSLPSPCVAALTLLYAYLRSTQGDRVAHLGEPVYYPTEAFLRLDRATRRNLNLVEGRDGGRVGSVLGVVDRSLTSMGKRLVRGWLSRPLADVRAIGMRLDGVEFFRERFDRRRDLRAQLREIGDLERLAGRIGAATASPRDLSCLAAALVAVEAVKRGQAAEPAAPCIEAAMRDLDGLPELREMLAHALVEDPPPVAGRAGVIRDGYNEEVDRLRSVRREGKGWMAVFEAAERKRTGIANLRIGYNKVFGYYLEASRAMHDRIPPEYERKQTLANAERYITSELKQREAEVLGAEERLALIETHLFEELRTQAAARLAVLRRTALAVALLDALAGFAEAAHRLGYVRPEVHRAGVLDIVEGRHPVVESVLGASFVPNDCRLGEEDGLLMVITGPNMAGKSTYLRQVALITLLAHCGSFVPATSAKIPLVDRIFTRIGAGDDLAGGKSTFMVEMTETADILRNMTARSLVILDEIGRGTSTFDGISIAWAVAEKMVAAGVKTLFATHYHELAVLAAVHDKVANFSVAVRRYKGEVVFLYRVVPGAASASYGIEVARLAGLPESVVAKARRLLDELESGKGPASVPQGEQLGLFSDTRSPEPGTELIGKLAATQVERLSPIEALTLLDRFVREARKRP